MFTTFNYSRMCCLLVALPSVAMELTTRDSLLGSIAILPIDRPLGFVAPCTEEEEIVEYLDCPLRLVMPRQKRIFVRQRKKGTVPPAPVVIDHISQPQGHTHSVRRQKKKIDLKELYLFMSDLLGKLDASGTEQEKSNHENLVECKGTDISSPQESITRATHLHYALLWQKRIFLFLRANKLIAAPGQKGRRKFHLKEMVAAIHVFRPQGHHDALSGTMEKMQVKMAISPEIVQLYVILGNLFMSRYARAWTPEICNHQSL